MLFDYLKLWLALSLGTFVYSIYFVWQKLYSLQGIPKCIPWAGSASGLLWRGQSSCKSLFGLRGLLDQGYRKYSKRGQPFVLPNLFTGHEVIVPMRQIPWLLEQPDHVLSQHEVNKQFLCASYTMLHHKIIGEARLGDFIRRELTRDLDTYANAIVDEIEASLDSYWGTSEDEWQELDVYEVMVKIIGRLVNRVLVGLPLCRDPAYLLASTTFAQSVVITAGLINFMPSFLRPFFGPLITAYDNLQYRRMAKVIQPIVRERALAFGPGIALKKKQDSSQPNDFITWALREAYSSSDLLERTPEMITKRLAVLGFAAIQSSAITVTNALFDIAASPESANIQEELRLEAEATAAKHPDGPWTRVSLARMTKTDSVLRESLRLWGFVSHGVTKAVVARTGITLPSGEHLPCGAKVGIASYGPQHDEDVYAGAMRFDAFRFSRGKESSHSDERLVKEANSAPTQFVTTSEYYMGFSHGRNACPGRFFASQQLKLLLAHISMRYHIRPISERPENPWLNNTIGPPIGEKLKVKQRKGWE